MRDELIPFIAMSLVGGVLIFLILYFTPKCIKSTDGYCALTTIGNKYFLSEEFELADKMYDGMIVKCNNFCVEYQ